MFDALGGAEIVIDGSSDVPALARDAADVLAGCGHIVGTAGHDDHLIEGHVAIVAAGHGQRTGARRRRRGGAGSALVQIVGVDLFAVAHVGVAVGVPHECGAHGGIGVQFLVELAGQRIGRRVAQGDAPVALRGLQVVAVDAHAIAGQILGLVLVLHGLRRVRVGHVGEHALEHIAAGRGGAGRLVLQVVEHPAAPAVAVVARGAGVVVPSREGIGVLGQPVVLLKGHRHRAHADVGHVALDAVVEHRVARSVNAVVLVAPHVVAEEALGAVDPAQGQLVVDLIALPRVARILVDRVALGVHGHRRVEAVGLADAALEPQVVVPHGRHPVGRVALGIRCLILGIGNRALQRIVLPGHNRWLQHAVLSIGADDLVVVLRLQREAEGTGGVALYGLPTPI